MRKMLVLFILVMSVLAFSLDYSPVLAGLSAVGSSAGAYIGENLAVPALIIMNKMGFVSDDIFSPFSTVMADAIETGAVVGTVIGGVIAKHVYLAFNGDFQVENLIVDSVISSVVAYVAHEVVKSFCDDSLISDIFVVPGINGLVLGGVW